MKPIQAMNNHIMNLLNHWPWVRAPNHPPSLGGLVSRFLGLDNIHDSRKLIVASLMDPLSGMGLYGT